MVASKLISPFIFIISNSHSAANFPFEFDAKQILHLISILDTRRLQIYPRRPIQLCNRGNKIPNYVTAE